MSVLSCVFILIVSVFNLITFFKHSSNTWECGTKAIRIIVRFETMASSFPVELQKLVSFTFDSNSFMPDGKGSQESLTHSCMLRTIKSVEPSNHSPYAIFCVVDLH